MGKWFNLDSPFVQFMNKVADLMWLNILFVLCCIPLITIGNSITSMYYVTLKMVKNEESYITKSFFKSFKQNFVQAVIIWLIFIIAGGVIFVDYRIISGQMGINLVSGTLKSVMQVLFIALFIFYVFTFTFVFPLLSKFDNTIKNTIKNALYMSIRHFPVTLACIALFIIMLLLLYYIPVMSVLSLLLLFSLFAYISSLMFVRVFEIYIPKDSSEDTQAEEISGKDIEESDYKESISKAANDQ
ncbi:MAG: YesL family protein [Lachnospiraceae bacterium]|nr:YesL family protein [Lachnospiraceae bacterium]